MPRAMRNSLFRLLYLAVFAIAPIPVIAQTLSPGEARAIAKDAYIYGFPLVDGYRVQYSFFIDRDSPDFKAPWNQINSAARVFTPADKTVQTPNSDTPYSTLGLDLRAEPMVVSFPAVEKGRYYSAQFIDLYTFNFAYVGSRATGNGAASYLVVGPGWKGTKPAGVKAIIRSETELAQIVYRTQLFNPGDLDNVKRIQAGYKVQPLSQFLHKPTPSPAPTIDFIKPLSASEERTSPEFFAELNFLLQFCPTHPSEQALMSRFAKLGIGAGKKFDIDAMSPELRKAITEGISDAWKTFDDYKTSKVDTGIKSGGEGLGTRTQVKNDYLARMVAAVLGIYGNSKQEAMYPVYFVDSNKQKLDGHSRYTLHFAPGDLPPVNAFWSVTLYELPSSLLYANSLNRYLINSPMLPGLKRDRDGGLTLYVQHDSPGAGNEANWLPAPDGPFFTALRLYWPKSEALEGKWKAPPMRKPQ